MKLFRGALLGAIALSCCVTSALASASAASSLSLGRAATARSHDSKAVPQLPSWLAVALVGGVIAGAALIATNDPDSPDSP